MNADGRIASQGSLETILAIDAGLSNKLAEESKELEKAEEEIDEADLDVPTSKGSSGKLIVDEEIAVGHIGWPASEFFPVLYRWKTLNRLQRSYICSP